MIRYALTCAQDHAWEAWFDSMASFDSQLDRGLVECPVCGSIQVRKAPMAPAVRTTKGRNIAAEVAAMLPKPEAAVASEEAAPKLVNAPDSVKLPEPVRAVLDGLREHVQQNFDYVGDSFAREARAIHEGDSEPRQIYGEATVRETRELLEDGIAVAPLPDIITPRRSRDVN